MKFYLIISTIFLFSVSIYGQEKGKISFQLTLDQEVIAIDKSYYSPSIKDSVQFEAIRFYISNIQLFHNEQLLNVVNKKHHLIDLEETKSMQILVDTPTDLHYNKVKFNLGVDSLTNVSGAFGGDLDPSNGMYWTWQSGYINFKLEGITASCPARQNRFQFHLGGFMAPFNAIQTIELPITNSKNTVINIALDDFFNQIDLKQSYQVMSPNEQSVKMAQLIASIFSVSK